MFGQQGSTKQMASDSSISPMKIVVLFEFELSFCSAFVSLLLFRRQFFFQSRIPFCRQRPTHSSQLATTRRAMCCTLFLGPLQDCLSFSFFLFLSKFPISSRSYQISFLASFLSVLSFSFFFLSSNCFSSHFF